MRVAIAVPVGVSTGASFSEPTTIEAVSLPAEKASLPPLREAFPVAPALPTLRSQARKSKLPVAPF